MIHYNRFLFEELYHLMMTLHNKIVENCLVFIKIIYYLFILNTEFKVEEKRSIKQPNTNRKAHHKIEKNRQHENPHHTIKTKQ